MKRFEKNSPEDTLVDSYDFPLELISDNVEEYEITNFLTSVTSSHELVEISWVTLY